jgi:hypothetical protein
MIALTEYADIYIVSGEGEGRGHVEKYNGKRTMRAIKSRLTRERCSGDRWARAEFCAGENEYGEIRINVETGEYC